MIRKFGFGLVSGVVLYIIWTYVVGFFAAVTMPKAYFEWFGPHKVSALILEEGIVVALPSFLFVLLWAWLTQRFANSSRADAWVICIGCLGGLASWWAIDLAPFLRDSASQTGAEPSSLLGSVYRFVVPFPWGVLNAAAAPSGVVVAWLIARRSKSPRKPTAPPSLRGASAAA